MFIHPDNLLEIARQRHGDLLADARRRRIATLARRRAEEVPWSRQRPSADGGRSLVGRSPAVPQDAAGD